MVIPPISGYKSLPPVPIICETPKPRCSIRQATSWAPEPDAPTMPTGPNEFIEPAANATPLIKPTPASGPITNLPFFFPYSLIFLSSSKVTLSEKMNKSNPLSKAFIASVYTYSPGRDIWHKSNVSAFNSASSKLVNSTSLSTFLRSMMSIAAWIASSHLFSLSQSTAITKSSGVMSLGNS